MPTPEELQALTDTELDQLRLNVAQERIRREELAVLPAQVDQLIQRFVDHGGDKSKIRPPESYTRNPRNPPTPA